VAHNLVLDRIPRDVADPDSWIYVLFLSGWFPQRVEMLIARIFFKRKLLRPAVGLVVRYDLCCVGAAAYATAKYVLTYAPIRGL